MKVGNPCNFARVLLKFLATEKSTEFDYRLILDYLNGKKKNPAEGKEDVTGVNAEQGC